MITLWATPDTENNFEQVDLFHQDFPHVIRNVPETETSSSLIDRIISYLPMRSPVRAVGTIVKLLEGPRSRSTKKKLHDTLKTLIAKMTPEQMINLYDQNRKEYKAISSNQSISQLILDHVLNTRNRPAAQALLEYNRGQGKLPTFWIDSLQQVASIPGREKYRERWLSDENSN
jgi:hypothetical protein